MEIWGRLKEPQKLSLYTGNSPDDQNTDVTKASTRKKVLYIDLISPTVVGRYFG